MMMINDDDEKYHSQQMNRWIYDDDDDDWINLLFVLNSGIDLSRSVLDNTLPLVCKDALAKPTFVYQLWPPWFSCAENCLKKSRMYG
jgi:hypothetical protein